MKKKVNNKKTNKRLNRSHNTGRKSNVGNLLISRIVKY